MIDWYEELYDLRPSYMPPRQDASKACNEEEALHEEAQLDQDDFTLSADATSFYDEATAMANRKRKRVDSLSDAV